MDTTKLLKLFQDDGFYNQVTPILVRFPEKEEQKEDSASNYFGYFPSQNFKQFIVPLKTIHIWQQLNEQKQSRNSPLIIQSIKGELIEFDKLIYSTKGTQDKEEILLSIQDSSKTPVFLNSSTTLFNNSQFNEIIYGFALKALINNKMDVGTFLEHAPLEALDSKTTNSLINIIKENNQYREIIGDRYCEFFKKVFIPKENDKNDFAHVKFNQNSPFTASVLEDKKDKVNLIHLNIVDSLDVNLNEKIELKAHIISHDFKHTLNGEKFNFSPLNIKHMIALNPEERNLICEKLSLQFIDGKNLGNELKNRIHETNEKLNQELYQERETNYVYSLIINWQKISIEKFPALESSITNEDGIKNLEKPISRNQIYEYYPEGSNPVLMQIIAYLELAEYKIADSTSPQSNFNNEIDEKSYFSSKLDFNNLGRTESRRILLDKNGLIFNTYLPPEMDKEIIKNIVKEVVESISEKTLSDFNHANLCIDTIILNNKLKEIPLNNKEDNNFNLPFKI